MAIPIQRFRGVLGDGPVYREPDQVAETVRFLQAEDRFHARYLEEQDSALERFGPQRLLDLLAEFLKPARQRPSTPRALTTSTWWSTASPCAPMPARAPSTRWSSRCA